MKKDLKSLDLVSAWLMKAPSEAAKDTETLKKATRINARRS